MKIVRNIILFATVSTILFVACEDADDNGNAIFQETCNDGILNGDETEIDCGGPDCAPCGVAALDFTGTYIQEDQMGRPEINTIFGTEGFRDEFNSTIPSEMQGNFQERFLFKLTDSTGLNPNYTTNILGLNAEEFTTLLSKDVLWLAQTGVTSYSNGSEILTGRALGDDVMDTTLLWIFGGPDGSENPGLISDGVSTNDATYSTSFPYLAEPF